MSVRASQANLTNLVGRNILHETYLVSQEFNQISIGFQSDINRFQLDIIGLIGFQLDQSVFNWINRI